MRLLIVGTLNGQLSTATKMAMDKGAKVTHAERGEQAVEILDRKSACRERVSVLV